MDAQSWDRHGMCRWLFFFAIAACIASPFFTTLAKANESGVTWLFEQQGHDGRMAAPADETTPPHASLEALRALRPVTDQAEAWGQLREFVEQASGPGIPEVPRRLIALSLSGEFDAEGLAELRRHQNPDGGFAAESGHQSSVLDTLDALEALAVAGLSDFDVLQPAIAFVAARQRTDGGFAATAESPSSVYLTARAVAGLQRYRIEYGLSGVLQAAVDFLAAREKDRGWGQTWQSAQALLALLPSTADTGRHAVALDALREAQGNDGSWDGSVYATALVLRALGLAAAEDPSSSPGSATLLGQVIDSRHGVVVPGGTVTAHGGGPEAWMATTGPDGRFLLQDLEPGPYTLAFSATGFQALTRNVELEAGQRSDLGTVVLDMEPESALVTGRVTDAATGEGMAATVALHGSGI
ncbi:MAG: carboxypeptidase regulatory-like domain-containing protein, partial [Thioalkalivibrio sp.]|nr:carboxypeptidase regulatory-like domain-containing protein [Thioalkalivibrio sp.]